MKKPRVCCDGCGFNTQDYVTHVEWGKEPTPLSIHYCPQCFPRYVYVDKPRLTEEDFWKELYNEAQGHQ